MSSTNQVIVSEGLMIMVIKKIESNELNSTGLLEISINTTVNHLFKNVGKELPKDVAKDNRLKENWITTIKYLRDDSPSLVATGAGQQSFQTWILTITPAQAACTFTGSYNISEFQIACIPGATCPHINNNQASIVLEIDSENFCAQTSAIIGLSSSLAVYSDPGVNFLVDDLPLQSAFLEMLVSSTAVNIRSLVIKNIVVTVTNNQNYLFAFGTPTSTVSVYTNGVWIPGINGIVIAPEISDKKTLRSITQSLEGLSKVVLTDTYNGVLNWATIVKDLRVTPDVSVTKPIESRLQIIFDKGFLIVQSLRDSVYYVDDLRDVLKYESFNPNEESTQLFLFVNSAFTVEIHIPTQQMNSTQVIVSEGLMIMAIKRIEANEVNSAGIEGLLEISINTAVNHLFKIIGKELPKDVSKDNRLNENRITTIKDLIEAMVPDSWIKWNWPMKLAVELRLKIGSEKDFLFVQSLNDLVYYAFSLYGNESIESGESMVNMDIDIKPDVLVTIDQIENWTISVGVKENTKILRDQEEMTGNYLLNNNLSQVNIESCSIKGGPTRSIISALANSQIEVISGKRTTTRSFTQSLQGSSKGVSTYISALKNWATTTKDLRDTPGSWIKWNMTKLVEEPRLNIIFDKGFFVIQFLHDLVCYVVDLSDVPKCGSFNPYGNEQMAEGMSVTDFIASLDIEVGDRETFLGYFNASNYPTVQSLLDNLGFMDDMLRESKASFKACGAFKTKLKDKERELSNMNVEQPEKEKPIFQKSMEFAESLGLLRDFSRPFIPMALEYHNLEAIDREASCSEFIRALCIRWKNYEDYPKSDTLTTEYKRIRNRLLSTSCFPGGGKTFFLDSVSKFIATITQNYVQALFSDWPESVVTSCTKYLQSLVILNISFNGWSTLGGGYSVDRYIAEIILRLLYSFYFTKGNSVTFGQFVMHMQPSTFSSTASIAQCIYWFDQYFSRPANYLLLVDELEKSSAPVELCTYVCQFMDQLEVRFDCFFTNLNSYVMEEASTTRSQRPVKWISLPPAKFKSVQKIFESYKIPSLLVAEVTPHWRSIILLLGILKEEGCTSLQYDYLNTVLLSRLLPFVKPLSEPIVEACFSRRSYLTSDRIDNTPASQLISNGLFLNSINDLNSPFYPEISLLLLKQYCALGSVNSHLKYLFNELFKLDSTTTWSFSSYEAFHCFWLAIFHYCRYFKTARIATISEFYASRLLINDCVETKVKFVKEMHVKQATLANIKQIEFDTIYLLGKANPGFDSIIFYESYEGRTVAVASENKFSDPSSSTKFSPTQIVEKRNLAIHAISRFNIKEDDIYFVFPIWRDAPDYMNAEDGQVIEWSSNAKSEVGSLRNVIVLARKDLEFLYGPLHRRLYFQCDMNSTVSYNSSKREGGLLLSLDRKKGKVEVEVEVEVEEIAVEADEETSTKSDTIGANFS